MHRIHSIGGRAWPILFVVLMLLAACSPAGEPRAGGDGARGPDGARRSRVLVASILSSVDAMTHAGNTTTSGGWQSYNEVHSNGRRDFRGEVTTAYPAAGP